MRELHFNPVYSGLSAIVLLMGARACIPWEEYCALTLLCSAEDVGVVDPPGDGGVGPDGGDPECVATPSRDPSVLRNECGVFVRASGDDTRQGTREEPVQTLSKAIAIANQGPKRVYACAELFEQSVDVQPGVQLYGGLDCDNGWTRSDAMKKTSLTAAAGEIPLKLLAGEGLTKIEDFEVTARDATTMGDSSIAVIAGNVALELANCSFIAGSGQAGGDGDQGGDEPPLAASGLPGTQLCAEKTKSGDPGVNTCEGVNTRGGYGGSAGEWNAVSPVSAADGENGQPSDKDYGLGGKASGNTTSTSCPEESLGLAGKEGEMGLPGSGGHSNGNNLYVGSLEMNLGFKGVDGLPGFAGTPGQGGGGGGGRSWLNSCSSVKPGNGPAGAGGGAGGCGGKGGLGGKAGGSSIALVLLGERNVTLVDIILQTGAGGKGGNGGLGQAGQVGGDGGVGTWHACSGGEGGDGGKGGRGGGGSGGHSIGIAYLVGPISPTGAQFNLEFASAGPGGKSDSQDGAGQPGTADTIVKFANE